MLVSAFVSSQRQSWRCPRAAALAMCTNSRELRFFSGVSPVAPSTVGTTTTAVTMDGGAGPEASATSSAATSSTSLENSNNNSNNSNLSTHTPENAATWLLQQATTQFLVGTGTTTSSTNPTTLASALWDKWMQPDLGSAGTAGTTATTTATTTSTFFASTVQTTSSTATTMTSSSTTTSTTTARTLSLMDNNRALGGLRFFHDGLVDGSSNKHNNNQDDGNSPPPNKKINSEDPEAIKPVQQGYGSSLVLTDEEKELFSLLRRVRKDTHVDTTLRVAGGWVRDKLLATPEFNTYHAVFEVAGKRLTSKFRMTKASPPQQQPSLGRLGTKILTANDATQKPVDIDIALDDMLGREFAEHLNDYLSSQGEETHSVGVVLKNPEKSKHLETATMKVGTFWIDFVNLRAEEYTQDSRIPDLMRIGTASEDAFRRDLTINALFYNINTGEVEDWTGRGFDDLRKGIVATPLPPLTTLLDDPLRVLRSVRFAARLRFTMDDDLTQAAKDVRVRTALAQKVSRERVGGEVDLMLRSPDPVGAMRLLLHLDLIETVYPQMNYHHGERGLALLSTAHDHLADCRWSPPIWCQHAKPGATKSAGGRGLTLLEDEESRRLLWYTSFLKPLWDFVKEQQESAESAPVRQSKKQKRQLSPVKRLLVDDLKRPARDADAIEKILKAGDEISDLMAGGGVVSGTMILLSDIDVRQEETDCAAGEDSARQLYPFMSGRRVDATSEDDPVWSHAMDFRLACSKILQRIGPLWRAALFLALSEELCTIQTQEDGLEYAIEGDVVNESQEERRRGIIEKYDIFASSMVRLGLIGCWDVKPLLDGGAIKKSVLPRIPKGPAFRDVMEEQTDWMATHPGADADALVLHLKRTFPDFVAQDEAIAK